PISKDWEIINRSGKTMSPRTTLSFLFILFALVCLPFHAASNPAHFSRLPAFEEVKLSPNGKRIVFVENVQSAELSVLSFIDVEEGKRKHLLRSDNTKVKINWFRWKTDDILMVSARFESKRNTVRFYQTRLYSIDVTQDKIELKLMLKNRNNNPYSQFQDSVVHWLPDDPKHILMEADLKVDNLPDVYRVNVKTGKTKRVERGKRAIRSWIADRQGVVRIGLARNYDNGRITYFYRSSEDDKFEELFEYYLFKDKPITVLGFDLDPNQLYYLKYDGNYQALYRMDLQTRQSIQLLKHDNYDVSGGLIVSPLNQDVIGIYDAHSPFARFYFEDKSYMFHRSLEKAIPERKNYVRSRSTDEMYYILYSESDSSPGMYFYGNRNDKSLELLFTTYPELRQIELPKHKSVSYTARDGMEIEGYLTLPLVGEAPYPTIIHPHGGPGARDYKGFDPWVAYLVHKGYAVMRPNFRGSTGFGCEFAQAQMGRWGLEMQDDITDAAQFLFDKGIADENRICIFGASYGGYAAKMATVKTPDLFTCAVSFAGVGDLRRLKRQQRKFLGGDLSVDEQLGEESKDLKNRSPITHAAKIKTPMLIMHGSDDSVVRVQQSRDFVEELEDLEKDVRYVEFEQGDHYLSIQANRDMFFSELDTFLTKHLGKVEPNIQVSSSE
ncbi:MAG: S9 family peptidase, partial [Pseudomonadota bacterium]